MKLYILSDLHLEFGDFQVPDVSPDAVLIAGDLHRGTRGLRWAAERLPAVPIVYVAGNHEFYRESTPRLLDKLRSEAKKVDTRIHFLETEEVVLEGVTFLGATLWTDFAVSGAPSIGMAACAQAMTDYRLIRVDPAYRKVRPQDFAALHVKTRRWLEKELAVKRDGPVVVITHHAPSAESLHPDRTSDPVSAGYASHLDHLVSSSGAALWVHGHTHRPVDYRIGGTRVICNPRGYVPDELVTGFVPDLVIEI